MAETPVYHAEIPLEIVEYPGEESIPPPCGWEGGVGSGSVPPEASCVASGSGLMDVPNPETYVVSEHLVKGAVFVPQTKIMVKAIIRLPDGEEVPVTALVDTGAEVSLVRKDLIPPEYFVQVARKKRFLTADAR